MLHAVELTVLREGKPPIHAVAPLPEDFVELGFEEGIDLGKIWEQKEEEDQGGVRVLPPAGKGCYTLCNPITVLVAPRVQR